MPRAHAPSIDVGVVLGICGPSAKVLSMTHISRDKTVGVILAGGLSRRMGGGDKGLSQLGGATMLARAVRCLLPQVGRAILNANGDVSRFDGLGVPVVSDVVADYPGPLGGVLTGMRWAAGNAPRATHILTVPSDAPFLPADLASRLAGGLADSAARIALASSPSGLHPVIGLWPVDLADDLAAALASGVRKVGLWAERHGTVHVAFAPTIVDGEAIDPFFNVNTPAELDEARRLLELIRR